MFRRERYSDITQNTQFGLMWEWYEQKDDSRNQFFSDHYMNIRRARNVQFGDNIVNHELTGKKVLIDGKECWVESVHKHWLIGHYLVLLYYTIMENGGHSHGIFEYENINSHCPTIIEYLEENKNRIKI